MSPSRHAYLRSPSPILRQNPPPRHSASVDASSSPRPMASAQLATAPQHPEAPHAPLASSKSEERTVSSVSTQVKTSSTSSPTGESGLRANESQVSVEHAPALSDPPMMSPDVPFLAPSSVPSNVPAPILRMTVVSDDVPRQVEHPAVPSSRLDTQYSQSRLASTSPSLLRGGRPGHRVSFAEDTGLGGNTPTVSRKPLLDAAPDVAGPISASAQFPAMGRNIVRASSVPLGDRGRPDAMPVHPTSFRATSLAPSSALVNFRASPHPGASLPAAATPNVEHSGHTSSDPTSSRAQHDPTFRPRTLQECYDASRRASSAVDNHPSSSTTFSGGFDAARSSVPAIGVPTIDSAALLDGNHPTWMQLCEQLQAANEYIVEVCGTKIELSLRAGEDGVYKMFSNADRILETADSMKDFGDSSQVAARSEHRRMVDIRASCEKHFADMQRTNAKTVEPIRRALAAAKEQRKYM